MPFDVIMGNYDPNIIGEIKKYIDDGILTGEIITICDLRRKVEKEFGEGNFTNKEILESVVETGGKFTNRLENETGDMCYIDWEKIKKNLNNKIISLCSEDTQIETNKIINNL